jgi:hypothetical protein
MTHNRQFSTPVFVRACKLAGLQPTKRQASKWRNGKGKAHGFVNQAIQELSKEAK